MEDRSIYELVLVLKSSGINRDIINIIRTMVSYITNKRKYDYRNRINGISRFYNVRMSNITNSIIESNLNMFRYRILYNVTPDESSSDSSSEELLEPDISSDEDDY